MGQSRNHEETSKSISNYIMRTTYQNLQNAAKMLLRGKFIVSKAYSRKEEKCKINS